MSSIFQHFAPTLHRMFGGNGATEDGQQQTAEDQQPEVPLSTQIKLSDDELKRIANRINTDYDLALAAHDTRIRKVAAQERLWREKVGLPGGEQGDSNFRVPITTALILSKHAREFEALFGPNAGATATPEGPSDAKAAKRISLAMTWQFFENMRAVKPVALAALRRLKHGYCCVFVPWETKFYSKRENGKTERVQYHAGPTIYPLGMDEFMFPADVEGCDTPDDAAWIMRRYKTTPTEMLLRDNVPGEPQTGDGDWYQGVGENFEKLVQHARHGIRRDSQKDATKIEQDLGEGMQRDMAAGIREYLELEEWYIRHRLEAEQPDQDKSKETDAQDTEETLETAGNEKTELPEGTFRDAEGVVRERLETDLLIRYHRELQLVVGVQRLDELYPDSPKKRPIHKWTLLNDGTFYPPGVIELGEEIEVEMSILVNKLIEAIGLSIAPPIFVEPTVGENFLNRKYGTYDLIPTANANGAKQMQFSPQTEGFNQLWFIFQSIYEQLFGITNATMGRGLDQPNAPRTLGGQRLVAGAGDVRLALDMRNFNQDLKGLLDWIWDLWRMFGSEQEFYRVAEGDAPRGTFKHGELENGFASLSPKEREGHYDFSFDFADEMATREAKKQEIGIVASFLASLPVFAQNASAQYRFATELCEVFGLDFTSYMDEPPPDFTTRTPESEWNALLQGEEIHVHPNDNHDQHIEHFKQRMMAMAKAPEEDRNVDAMFQAMKHNQEHEQAKIQKQQMQELMQGLQQMMTIAQNGAGLGQGQPGTQQGQNPPAMLGQGAQQ